MLKLKLFLVTLMLVAHASFGQNASHLNLGWVASDLPGFETWLDKDLEGYTTNAIRPSYTAYENIEQLNAALASGELDSVILTAEQAAFELEPQEMPLRARWVIASAGNRWAVLSPFGVTEQAQVLLVGPEKGRGAWLMQKTAKNMGWDVQRWVDRAWIDTPPAPGSTEKLAQRQAVLLAADAAVRGYEQTGNYTISTQAGDYLPSGAWILWTKQDMTSQEEIELETLVLAWLAGVAQWEENPSARLNQLSPLNQLVWEKMAPVKRERIEKYLLSLELMKLLRQVNRADLKQELLLLR